MTELPYQINKADLVKKIAELARDRKIDGISEVRDESDRKGMRMVVELKRDANPDSVLNSPVYDPSAPLPADAGAPVQPPGFNSPYIFSMAGVYQGDTSFAATPIWVTGTQPPSPFVSPSPYGYPSANKSAFKLTIIGVVDNSDDAHFGLYIPRGAIAGYNPSPSTPDAETYYFKVAPGQDKRALALALGSAFLDNGLETTVLEDAIWQIRGPRIFLSNVLLALVGLILLLGVTALAITGTRAVIERRQLCGAGGIALE